MLGKFIPAPSAGCNRDRARAERLPAGDVARCVANDVNLGRGELLSVLLLCAGPSESPKLVPVTVVIGERAKLEKVPDAVVLQL
jgi:hypothetical protein